MNWKSRIRKLTRWRPKNGGKSSRNCSQKRLESVTEAPRLGFSSQNHFFSLKTTKIHSIGVRDLLLSLFALIYSQNGEEVAPSSPRRAQEVSWCTPQIVKFIPPFRILWKSYRSIAKAYRTWFSSFSSALSPILSEICLLRVSEMLRKPRMPFFNKMGEVVAAQLAQAS